MDMSVYSNYYLVNATVNFARRVKAENPALWAKIQAEAAQAEAEKAKKEAFASAGQLGACP